ncbi:MAG: nucleotidyltransferase domain-containing protein [Thermoleophilia bacterium]
MKLTRIIEVAFGTPARIAILRRLATVSQPLSGRQLADLTGLSHRGVIQAIVPLVEAGIITRRQAGRAHQYQLSRKNSAVVKIILPAFKKEAEIRDDLMEELVNNFAADTASLVLFGSFARSEESNVSDVDILAIARTSREKQKVEEIGEIKAGAFREKYAAPLSLHCLTLEELKSRSQSAFIKGVGREGILLSGKPVEELVRGDKAKDQKRTKN